MANKKISDYTEALSAAADDFFEISVDLGGGSYATRKIKKSNLGLGGSPLTTKGDLYTFDSADARLAVGSDGQVLIADSAEATGLRWGSVSASNIYNSDDSLTGTRTVTFNGNDLIFNTSASNRFRIWSGGGGINDSLAFWDAGSGNMRASFYTWELQANGGSNPALKIQFNGEASFAYDVRFSNAVTNSPAANTRVHINAAGTTSSFTALKVANSADTAALRILGDLAILMENLPTSSAGLATGQLWNNSGVVNIV